MAFSPEIDIRRKILEETRHLLISEGLNRLSIRMIARAVGCSVGTIYVYFKNKDVLVHDLIAEGFEMLIAVLEKAQVAYSRPLDRLAALARAYIDFALQNPEYYEIMFMLKPQQMARFPAEKYRRARRTIDIISQTLTDCAAAGKMTLDDGYMGAHVLWAFMHGLVGLIQAQRMDKRIQTEVLIDTSIRQILGMYARG